MNEGKLGTKDGCVLLPLRSREEVLSTKEIKTCYEKNFMVKNAISFVHFHAITGQWRLKPVMEEIIIIWKFVTVFKRHQISREPPPMLLDCWAEMFRKSRLEEGVLEVM